jgi:hypothetical protein
MSEFDGTGQEPDFEDPSYAHLRELLAGARADSPVPTDVLAKLEATLSGLVAEREEAQPDAEERVVTRLRHRVRGPRLLGAAAAAVLVAGVGIGLSQVSTGNDGNDGSDKSAAADSAGSSVAGSPVPTAKVPQLTQNGTGATRTPPGSVARSLDALAGLRFTRSNFAQQAARYVSTAQELSPAYGTVVPNGLAPTTSGTDHAPEAVVPSPDSGTTSGDLADSPGQLAVRSNMLLSDFRRLRPTAACPGPSPTDGALVLRITFAGRPATLVLHPVIKGYQFVAAWSCDGSQLLAATTVEP